MGISGRSCSGTFVCSPSSFARIPGRPFAYWATSAHRYAVPGRCPKSNGYITRQGMVTCDNFRFTRLLSEVIPQELRDGNWRPFAKGGAYSPFYCDLSLAVVWGRNQPELEAFGAIKGNAARSRQSSEFYFHLADLTWPLGAKAFSPQALPADCIFSVHAVVLICCASR